MEDPRDALVLDFREGLVRLINETYARSEHRAEGPADLRTKFRVLAANDELPGVKVRTSREGRRVVVMNRKLLEALKMEGRLSLRDLADMLGWKYDRKYAERAGDKLVGYSAVLADEEELLALLEGSREASQ